MPNRMFVTVDYEGDGSDQPDWKAATKSIELLHQFKRPKTILFGDGTDTPALPECRPQAIF